MINFNFLAKKKNCKITNFKKKMKIGVNIFKIKYGEHTEKYKRHYISQLHYP